MLECRNQSEYLLELLRCALNDRKPSEKPTDVQWHEVYSLAFKHSVSAFAYYALSLSDQQIGATVVANWQQRYNKLLVKGSNQMLELEQICSAFSANEIQHMPLKGSSLREMMAHPEMREMSDLDILVPIDQIDRAKTVMSSLGYEECEDNGNHITFKKLPYLYVEIHRQLIDPKYEFYPIFEDPWKYAEPTDDPYRFALSNEDFYLYLLTHAAKHYYYQGTGIRSVLDIHLLRKAYADRLDLDYIDSRITVELLADFRVQIEALADAWFAEAEADDIFDSEMAYYILNSSTYGSHKGYDRRVVKAYMQAGKSEESAKRAYFCRMVFLPREEMQTMYPVLKKAPVLLPFCWVARWGRILLHKPDSIKKRYDQVQNIEFYKKEDK